MIIIFLTETGIGPLIHVEKDLLKAIHEKIAQDMGVMSIEQILDGPDMIEDMPDFKHSFELIPIIQTHVDLSEAEMVTLMRADNMFQQVFSKLLDGKPHTKAHQSLGESIRQLHQSVSRHH